MARKTSTEMLYEIIDECYDKLNEWEEEFISSIENQIEQRLQPLTEKQEAKIKEIYERYFN